MAISTVLRTSSICSVLTSDRPIAPDLALVLQVLEHADLVLERHLLVDAVQLEQVDALEAEATQAHLGLLAQVLGPADRQPDVRPVPHQAGLRRDQDVVGVRVQRLADDLLADVRAVGVGGVDELRRRARPRGARRATHSSRSSGSPQMPWPVRRIAPKPSRWTVLSAISNVPDGAALTSVLLMAYRPPGSSERMNVSSRHPYPRPAPLARRWHLFISDADVS